MWKSILQHYSFSCFFFEGVQWTPKRGEKWITLSRLIAFCFAASTREESDSLFFLPPFFIKNMYNVEIEREKNGWWIFHYAYSLVKLIYSFTALVAHNSKLIWHSSNAIAIFCFVLWQSWINSLSSWNYVLSFKKLKSFNIQTQPGKGNWRLEDVNSHKKSYIKKVPRRRERRESSVSSTRLKVVNLNLTQYWIQHSPMHQSTTRIVFVSNTSSFRCHSTRQKKNWISSYAWLSLQRGMCRIQIQQKCVHNNRPERERSSSCSRRDSSSSRVWLVVNFYDYWTFLWPLFPLSEMNEGRVQQRVWNNLCLKICSCN